MTELDAVKGELRGAVEAFIEAPTVDRFRAVHDALWNLHDASNDSDLVEVMAAPPVPSAPGWTRKATK
jgi:hypothetical protein